MCSSWAQWRCPVTRAMAFCAQPCRRSAWRWGCTLDLQAGTAPGGPRPLSSSEVPRGPRGRLPSRPDSEAWAERVALLSHCHLLPLSGNQHQLSLASWESFAHSPIHPVNTWWAPAYLLACDTRGAAGGRAALRQELHLAHGDGQWGRGPDWRDRMTEDEAG